MMNVLPLVLIMPILQTSGEIIAKSWGGPQITTVDQHSYSFNGRGEYTFLETKNRSDSFSIQVRTDYLIEGNFDSTIFVAFVLTANGRESLTVTLNRNETTLYLYSSNGTSLANSKQCKGHGQSEMFMWFCLGEIFGIFPKQKLGVNLIRFSVGMFMEVEIIGRNITGMKGLAGNLENDSYVSNNGIKYKNTNVTEEQLYYYGESFKIKSENDSNFNYTITGGNFTYWERNHVLPRFLNKLAREGNYSELFNTSITKDINNFTATCTDDWDNSTNIQCLLIIAKTKDIRQGEYIMNITKKEHMDYYILHNKPPKFTTHTPTFLNVSYGSTKVLDLKKYARDDYDATDQIQYRVITNLPEYNIVNGVFNWTVGEELRYDDFSLTFILNDTLGFASLHDMNIFYCGCEQNSQCDYSRYNKNSSDTVKKALCNCPEYTSGLYCEIEEDPCKDYHCYTTCNRTLSRKLPSWPCEECPIGSRNKIVYTYQTCENINECDSLHKPCEQLCNDTDGSYFCGCHDGYTLNVDKYTCGDINECASMHNPCEQLCNDTDGSYVCGCYDGYKLNVDKHTCDDINECARMHNPCEQLCNDTDGSYVCGCHDGYTLNVDKHTCDDINECQQDQGMCPSKNEICVNTRGNYSCFCPPGYGFTGNMCTKSGSVEDFVNVKCSDSTWDIELDMSQLQTQYPGVRSSEIFFGESKCLGKQEGSILKFEYDLHNCKTTYNVSGITHIYNNKLFYVIFDPVIPFLIRRHIWTFTVECDVIKGGTGTSHLHHGIETHHATYVNHFNVSVKIYSDQNFRNPIVRDADSIHIGDDVFVKVTTDIADWNTKMRLHTCLTKPYVNASSDRDVVLIRNGCEVDRNTHIISQSTHETSFMFKDFEYLTNDEGLDIYCNATFCDNRDFTPECSQSCNRVPPIIG